MAEVARSDAHASILTEQAQNLLDVKRFDDALRKIAEAIAADPSYARAYAVQAGIFVRLDQQAKALSAAENYVRLMPHDEWGHRLRSIALKALKRFDEALDAAQEAVRLEPETAETHRNLANIFNNLDRYADAKTAAENAHRLAPEDPNCLEMLGRVAILEKDYVKAEEYLRATLALDPNSGNTLHLLGITLEKQGKKAESIEYLRLATASDPSNSTYRSNLLRIARAHAGYIGLGIFGLLKLLSVIGRNIDNSHSYIKAGVVILILALLGWALFVSVRSRRRRKEFHPTVRTFLDSQEKAERATSWRHTAYGAAIFVAVVAIVVVVRAALS